MSFEKLNLGKSEIPSIVYSSIYDKTGNLWLATEDGVLRCNSNQVFSYNSPDKIPAKLGNRIFILFKDNSNNLWIGTEKGIAKFDYTENRFIEISSVKKVNRVNAFLQLGEKIVICSVSGLWEYKDGIIIPIVQDIDVTGACILQNKIVFSSNKGLFVFENSRINKINDLRSGLVIKNFQNEIYLGTRDGELFKSSENSTDFKKIELPKGFKNITIRDIETKKGKIYLALDGLGVCVVDKSFSDFKLFSHNENESTSISSNGVYDIYFGNDGVDWYSTYGGGICYFIDSKSVFKNSRHELNNANSLLNNTCRAIVEVDNSVWYGTKQGISIYNKSTKNWKHILTKFGDKLTENIILSFAQSGDYIWAGTFGNGVFKINKNNFSFEHYSTLQSNDKKIFVDKVFSVFKDSKNNIWVGGIDGYVTIISSDKINSVKLRDIRCFNEIADGNIIAAGRQGVFIIDSNTFAVSSIKELRPDYKLNYNTVNSISKSGDNLMLCTNGNGLVFYNLKSKKIAVLDKESNLPSSIIQGIIQINPNNLWVSTTKGISNIRINKNDTIVRNFNKSDGLSSNEFNYGSFYKGKNNTLYFGGIEGVTYFNPEELKSRKIFPNVVFEELRVENKIVLDDKKMLDGFINEVSEINLSYRQNSFSLKFAGVLHGYPLKVRYSYILENYDEEWKPLTENNEIIYTNLRPGSYSLKIKAINEFGEFGNTRELKIIVHSPWYLTFWAFLLYLIIIGTGIYFLIEYTKILESKKNKEEQISFFNNLTHEIKTPLAIIKGMLDGNSFKVNESKETVNSAVDKINSMVNQMLAVQRYSLSGEMELNVSKINLKTHISNLIREFDPILKQKNLTVDFNCKLENTLFYFDEEKFDKIIVNLFSNAIKYSNPDNSIKITTENNDGNFNFIIQDFGIGIPKEDQKKILTKFFRAKNAINNQISGTGLGLIIVKNIIDATHGKLEFDSIVNQGTIFKVQLKSLEHLYVENAVNEFEDSIQIEVGENIEKYSNYKVLVVDDNDDLRNYLKRVLENYFLVFEAKNGLEGLEIASNVFPDLVITDYMMPIMDGDEMSNKIKSDINLNHIPIIILTALNDAKHKRESFEKGITDYIEKPIDVSVLLAKIISIFDWQNAIKDRILQDSNEILINLKPNRQEEFIIKLQNIILDNIENEDFGLDEICSILGMSRTSLYMKLKKIISISPQDFIVHTKLNFSKKLLLDDDMNIKEVAYKSGFSNPKYYSTLFKKVFGITPSEFIKEMNK